MPAVNIQGVGMVNFPDTMQPAEIQAAIETEILPKAAKPAFQEPQWLQSMRASGVDNPTTGMGTAERLAAGYGAAVPNMWAGLKQRLGMADQTEIDKRKALQAPLMQTGAGFTGNMLGNLAATVPTAAIPGANTVGGAALLGAATGAVQPTATGESAAANAGLGAIGGAVGQKIATALGGYLGRKASEKAAAGAARAVTDAALREGRAAGYVVSPVVANPTAWNRLISGLAGKTAVGQRAALLNQATTNKLAREAIGLAEDAPLTYEALDAARRQAGSAYGAIKAIPQIELGHDFQAAIGNMKPLRDYLFAVAETPELKNPAIEHVLGIAQKDVISGNGLVAVTQMLRESADKAFRSGDKTVGKIIRGVSDALESAGERALSKTGDDTAVKSFQAARQYIAKTYSIEKALNPATGNVVASKLAAQLAKRKPLSGGLKTIAKFGGVARRETQEVSNSSWLQQPGPSPLDWAAATATTAVRGAGGDPHAILKGAITLGARPAAQALLTSKPYQWLMTTPSYAPGTIAKITRKAADSPTGRVLAREALSNILRAYTSSQNPLEPPRRY